MKILTLTIDWIQAEVEGWHVSGTEGGQVINDGMGCIHYSTVARATKGLLGGDLQCKRLKWGRQQLKGLQRGVGLVDT